MSTLDDRPTTTGGPDSGLRPDRRRFIGWVMAGSTLVVAADLNTAAPASAASGVPRTPVPSGAQVAEFYDLEDLQTNSAQPTSNLITITITEEGRAEFAIPRMEVGQGILTSTAMIVADELDLPVDKVDVTLAPARTELLYNQLTGGSNTTFSTFTPIRVAAAIARLQLLKAAQLLGAGSLDQLITTGGTVSDLANNLSFSYGELATAAASQVIEAVEVELKPKDKFKIIGTPLNRTDALAAVTGAKEFTADLQVKGALPTMVCRPPTHRARDAAASVGSLKNEKKILGMPGVKNVAVVPTGVAVRAKTFGQCIDAVRAMDVDWNEGPNDDQSDGSVLAGVKAVEIPLVVPDLPGITKTIDTSFEFMFRSSAALEPYTAIADVRSDGAEIWAGLKSPIDCQQKAAGILGVSDSQVKVNVITGGGSFGHKLFSDHALEAVTISKAMGKPVKLMWHRADEPRQGRLHPLATSRCRVTMAADSVLSFEQRHTSVPTDFSHGLGERLTAMADELPGQLGGLGFSESIFLLTQELPYNFGVLDQLLNETLQEDFSTGSMRNIYSPDVCTAAELTIDQVAKAMKKDPLEFRLEYLKNDRVKNVLKMIRDQGGYGRSMPAGTAQGVAVHKEYKGATAVMVEIDCRPKTVNRDLGPETMTGARVTKVVVAVDAGLVINPRGLEAQMQGGVMDGIAMTLTASCHLRKGHFLEASWDNYFYTRQWNVPPEVEVLIVDSDSDTPGGAGEAAVGSTAAATACAYAKATGKVPKRFPVNHDDPLRFKPKSFIPPVPQSPTNGLNTTY